MWCIWWLEKGRAVADDRREHRLWEVWHLHVRQCSLARWRDSSWQPCLP